MSLATTTNSHLTQGVQSLCNRNEKSNESVKHFSMFA